MNVEERNSKFLLKKRGKVPDYHQVRKIFQFTSNHYDRYQQRLGGNMKSFSCPSKSSSKTGRTILTNLIPILSTKTIVDKANEFLADLRVKIKTA